MTLRTITLSQTLKTMSGSYGIVIDELRICYTAKEDVLKSDIELLSKNEFLFTYGLKSGNYGQKESGQTDFSTNLSALAPPRGLEPRTP